MSEADDTRSPVGQVVETLVYAPIGLFFEAPSLLPRLVEEGKTQARNARVIGELAVQRGQGELRRRLGALGAASAGPTPWSRLSAVGQQVGGAVGQQVGSVVGEQLDGILRAFGTVTRPDRDGPSFRPARDPAEPAPRPTVTGPSADGDELAITDYDSLSASQVVSRLAGLGEDELEAVRAYEAAHRGRKTILNKIVQLEGQA